MRTTCVSCRSSFDKTHRKGMTEYAPSVCSSECFADLIRDERYAKFPEFNLNRTSESINIFKHRSPQFRSSYEERFAKWMFKNNFTFSYEPYIFTLSNGMRYVPDFYLPSSKIFIEVKGLWMGNGKTKFKAFVEEFSFPTYLLDLPALQTLSKKREE